MYDTVKPYVMRHSKLLEDGCIWACKNNIEPLTQAFMHVGKNICDWECEDMLVEAIKNKQHAWADCLQHYGVQVKPEALLEACRDNDTQLVKNYITRGVNASQACFKVCQKFIEYTAFFLIPMQCIGRVIMETKRLCNYYMKLVLM